MDPVKFLAGARVRVREGHGYFSVRGPQHCLAEGVVYTVLDLTDRGTLRLVELDRHSWWNLERFEPEAASEEANPNKLYPVMRGLLDYFPDAALEVANCSLVANEQHNPGEPMHWAKDKSKDEADACVRHLMKRGHRDSDGIRHSAKAAWRALANLQREIEAERQA